MPTICQRGQLSLQKRDWCLKSLPRGFRSRYLRGCVWCGRRGQGRRTGLMCGGQPLSLRRRQGKAFLSLRCSPPGPSGLPSPGGGVLLSVWGEGAPLGVPCPACMPPSSSVDQKERQSQVSSPKQGNQTGKEQGLRESRQRDETGRAAWPTTSPGHNTQGSEAPLTFLRRALSRGPCSCGLRGTQPQFGRGWAGRQRADR